MYKILNRLSVIFLVILIILTTTLIILKNYIFPREYKDIVQRAASIYEVDPNLIFAMMKQESGFEKDATSKSGAKGLMQLMESTANEIAAEIPSINEEDYDIYDPYNNIYIGTKYMSYLIKYFDGNYYLAVVAYNAGLGRVTSWVEDDYNEYDTLEELLQNIEYEETKNYLINVIEYYEWYTKLY